MNRSRSGLLRAFSMIPFVTQGRTRMIRVGIAVVSFLCPFQVVAQVPSPVCPPFNCKSVVFQGALQTSPLGINAAGDIVGHYVLQGQGSQTFILHAGTFIQPTFPSPFFYAWGITAQNLVGMYQTDLGSGTRGFFMPTANFTDFTHFTSIDVPGLVLGGADETKVWGANEAGDVVGAYYKGGYSFQSCHGGAAFVRHDNAFYNFCATNADTSTAFAINAAGDIVGYYTNPLDSTSHGFLLRTANFTNFTNFTTIDVLGAIDTIPKGINAAGDIVGFYTTAPGVAHGFLLRTANFTNFTDFTTIDVQGATGTAAEGVNDSGRIVGLYQVGDSQTGQTYGFIADQNNGIDISRSATPPLPVGFWPELLQEGVRIVVTQAWGGGAETNTRRISSCKPGSLDI